MNGQIHLLATLLLYTQNTRLVGSTASQDTGKVKNLLPQMKHPAILITCNSLNTNPGILFTLYFHLFLISGDAKMLSVDHITKQHAEGAIYFG